MTGRLASAYITAAGIPQKIYTVPTGKVFSGKVVLYNSTGVATTVQVKHGQGITTPTASFPFSNARLLQTGADLPGFLIYNNGNGKYAAFDTSTSASRLWDLSDPENPAEVPGGNSSSNKPLTALAWAVADRYGEGNSSNYRRYSGTPTPWDKGASTYGEVNGGGGKQAVGTTQAGWGQYAAGCSSTTQNELVYTTALGTTGTVSWSAVAYSTLGIQDNNASYYTSASYMDVQVANGVFFLGYTPAAGTNWIRFAATHAANIGTSWTNVFAFNSNGTPSGGIPTWRIFHANGKYWLWMYRSSNDFDWRVIPEDELFTTYASSTPDWITPASSVSYGIYGDNANTYQHSIFQLPDGNIVWANGSGAYHLDTATSAITEWAGILGADLPPQYVTYGDSKLSKQTLSGNVRVTLPKAGATDTVNDRVAYTTSSYIYDFVSDDTWALQDVTDDSGWYEFDLSFANKAEVEYAGRMLNAADEIWVRARNPNVTVHVEGFLLDAAA